MNPKLKQRLIAAGVVGVILASCAWIYFTQIKSARHNVGLHQKIGEVLAERAAELVGKKGRLVTISISTKEWPELKTQIDAFKKKLKRLGDYELREYEMDTKDQPKYGVGSGLSGRRYVRTVKKNPNADLFVSFVGAPRLTNDEAAELGKKARLIAESRSGDNLPALFERKLIEVAVVSRFEFPAPGPEKPTTPEEWFVKRYQVLTADPGDKLSKTE
jgi:coenzyme F420-reducing hydrogenase delta subunit